MSEALNDHLTQAKSIHGEVWSLLEKQNRTEDENRRMVHAAHASLYHWLHAGAAVNEQRGEWLIARVYATLGRAESALDHAQRCRAITEEHSDEMKDFDIAYAFEGLARAYALAGQADEAARFKKQAREAGNAIADAEDRKIFDHDYEGLA